MATWRSTRKRKENSRYPGCSQQSLYPGEEEAEEPTEPDEVTGLRQQNDSNDDIGGNLQDAVTSSSAGLELAPAPTSPALTPQVDRTPGGSFDWSEDGLVLLPDWICQTGLIHQTNLSTTLHYYSR